jgi:hypothetical protein
MPRADPSPTPHTYHSLISIMPALVGKPVGPGLQINLARSRQQPTSGGIHALSRAALRGT